MKPKTWGNYWDYFGRRLIKRMEMEPGSRVLDVGTGGGSTLFPAAEAAGKRGHVLGIEQWDSMVDSVQSEITRCGVMNASVKKMDAREMSFQDASFDYAIAGFIGFDNYFDFESCRPIAENKIVTEMVRVLRQGGKAGFSTWLKQEDTEYVYQILSSLWPELDKPYSQESEKGWEAIMASAGFEDIHIIQDSYTFAFPSLEEWWTEISGYGWNRRMETIAENSDHTEKSMTKRIHENLGDHLRKDGSVAFKRYALYAIGTKP